MIELSVTDHLIWKWRVYNMILGYIELTPDIVGDHNGCRLGKWLKTLDQDKKGVSEILHCQVHAKAKQAIIAYNNKHTSEAEQILSEIEVHSTKVVEYLDKLKKELL